MLMTIREPRRGANEASGSMPHGSSLRETLRFIRSQRALIHVIAGATIATFSGMGLIWWTPAFLSRSHGFCVGEAGYLVGMMSANMAPAPIGSFLPLVLDRQTPRLNYSH